MENNQLDETSGNQREVCAGCGSPAIEKGYPTKLCAECREKYIRFPVPKWLWAFAAGIGVVLLFSLSTISRNISTGIAYEKGKKAEKLHRYVTAQREFEKVVAKQPDYVEGQGHLAKAAFYNLDLATFGKAINTIANKTIQDENLVSTLEKLVTEAGNYYARDTLQKLIDRYDSLKVILPANVLTGYLHNHDNDVYAKLMYASQLYDKKDYASFDSISLKILDADSDFVPCLRLLTTSQRENGNFDASIGYCNRLLNINREYTFAIASKARTLLKQKKDKDALSLALQAHEINKDDGYATATLALAYHFNGNISKREEIIHGIGKDSLANFYMDYTRDVITKKEKFRD